MYGLTMIPTAVTSPVTTPTRTANHHGCSRCCAKMLHTNAAALYPTVRNTVPINYKLSPCQSRPPRRFVIHSRPHVARIRDHLSRSNQNPEGHHKSQSHHAVKARSKTPSAQGAEESLPLERIMVPAPRRPVKFNWFPGFNKPPRK